MTFLYIKQTHIHIPSNWIKTSLAQKKYFAQLCKVVFHIFLNQNRNVGEVLLFEYMGTLDANMPKNMAGLLSRNYEKQLYKIGQNIFFWLG